MGPSFLLSGVICIIHFLLIFYGKKKKNSPAKHEMQTNSKLGNLKMNTQRVKKEKRKQAKIFYFTFFKAFSKTYSV